MDTASGSLTRFSVLICTYNRPSLLRKALQGLLVNQSEPVDELIVVNGGDAADETLANFGQMYSCLKVIKIRNVSLANSQNVGLHHCTGDIVALADDDAVVAQDWVAMMKQVHREHPEAGAVGGPVRTFYPDKLLGRVAHYTTFPEPAHGAYVRTAAGVNISYKRQAIQEVGPLDESLVSSEEVDYNWRLVRAGYRIWWDPCIVVQHHDRTTMRAYIRQQFTYGRGYFQTRRKWSDLPSTYPRSYKGWKEWFRLGRFFAGIVVDPVRIVSRIDSWKEKSAQFPVLVLTQVVHRAGYIYQAITGSSVA